MGGGEPFSPSTAGIEEFGRGLLFGTKVVEEASIDQVLRDDGGVTVFFGKIGPVGPWKLELVRAQSGEFALIIVPGIGPREDDVGVRLNGEVEFGGQFKVDEITGIPILEQEIQLPECGVNVALNLQIALQNIPTVRMVQESCQSIFVEMPQFLPEI